MSKSVSLCVIISGRLTLRRFRACQASFAPAKLARETSSTGCRHPNRSGARSLRAQAPLHGQVRWTPLPLQIAGPGWVLRVAVEFLPHDARYISQKRHERDVNIVCGRSRQIQRYLPVSNTSTRPCQTSDIGARSVAAPARRCIRHRATPPCETATVSCSSPSSHGRMRSPAWRRFRPAAQATICRLRAWRRHRDRRPELRASVMPSQRPNDISLRRSSSR